MNRKNLFLLIVVITGALAIMAGCAGGPQFGAPGLSTAISGRVATPESCFTDACNNPSIIEGKPLPGTIALFYGGDSGKLEIEGETECNGSFEVNATGEGSYVLYVVREYPKEGSDNYVVVKKGINDPRGNVGEANAYTTSQVIIWERVNALYGENFTPFDASWYAQYNWRWSFSPSKLVLPVSEIPNLEPTKQLVDAVEKALSECRDPQKDNKVIHFADKIADATFGAPGGGGAGGGGGGGGGGGEAVSSFTVTKTVDKNTISVGQTATYTVVVTNTGNQNLRPTVSDDKFTLPPPVESRNPNRILNVGETWTYTYSYTPTQIPTPNPLVNTVTVTVPGLTSQTAQASVRVTSAPPAQTSTITVKKVVAGDTDPNAPEDWDFSGDFGGFSLAAGGSQSFTVTPGQSYDITEDTQLDNWSTSYQVGSGSSVTDNSIEDVTAPDAGGTLTITFTNTYTAPTSTITVKKVVAGDTDPNAPEDWDFSGDFGGFSLAAGGSQSFTVTPGQSYNITETTQPAGWSTSWSTDPNVGSESDNQATVNVPAGGGDLIVTFTNTPPTSQTSTIKVKKVHANLAERAGEINWWDLHTWIKINNSSTSNILANITIKSTQSSTSTIVESSLTNINISTGENRYPSGSGNTWLLNRVGWKENGKPKDVLVEIWVYDAATDQLLAYGSKIAN